jgi:hypothetical protein
MAFIRDPRPVWQQVLSGLKIGAVLIAVGASVRVLWPYTPVPRIEAYIWHLRHGNTIEVGQYRVPVPKQWYVEHISANDMMLIDLNTGDVIRAGIDPVGLTLSKWSDLNSRMSTMETTGQRDFHISGEKFLCFEQDLDAKSARLYPIQCRSDGGLEVNFVPYLGVGRKHDAAFYSLMQRIQKF